MFKYLPLVINLNKKRIISKYMTIIPIFKFSSKKESKIEPKTSKYDMIKKVGNVNEPKIKITTKILCELIGTKHYPANEEIELDENEMINLVDENDKLINKVDLKEARILAKDLNKDLVLRNEKITPPIVKMTKYRVELIKRLLKKIGKNIGKDQHLH